LYSIHVPDFIDEFFINVAQRKEYLPEKPGLYI
jgi:hypothetical protein